jgi:hypothetical protein
VALVKNEVVEIALNPKDAVFNLVSRALRAVVFRTATFFPVPQLLPRVWRFVHRFARVVEVDWEIFADVYRRAVEEGLQ